MLISCIKVIKEANNMMISHDDYFHRFYSLITYCITVVIFFLITVSHYACNYFGRGAVAFPNGVHLRLEIRLLIFAWFRASHGEVVTNLISSPHLSTRVHRPPFSHDGWLVGETQGLQRESLMWQGSTIWLMGPTLIHSDALLSNLTSTTSSCSSAILLTSSRVLKYG